MEIEYVRSRFIKHFDGKTGVIYASPGRINLIGEHTDYNGGYVMPGAVDCGIMAELRPNNTNTIMCWQGCRTGTLVHCWWEGRMVQPLWETIWQFLTKLNVHNHVLQKLCS